MSTRGLIGIRVDGERKYSYNHSDSYPSWLGKQTAREFEQLLHEHGIEELRKKARFMKPVNASIPPDIATREFFAEFEDPQVGGDSTEEDWYRLFRKAQGIWRPFLMYGIYDGVVVSGNDEAPDMDAEYIYEWDLDNTRFIAKAVYGEEYAYDVAPFDWHCSSWDESKHTASRFVASSKMLDEIGDM